MDTKILIKKIVDGTDFKKKGYYYYKDFAPGIKQGFSLGITSYLVKYHRLVSPQIGVYYEAVEAILKDISSYNNPTQSPTIHMHIGYYMPENDWIQWDFCDENIEEMTPKIQSVILKYSEQFCKQYSTLDEILIWLLQNTWNNGFVERIPIVYYLLGRKDLGEKFINEFRKKRPKNLTFTEDYIRKYSEL